MADETNKGTTLTQLPGLEDKSIKTPRKPHKVFGEWRKCIVHPTKDAQKGTSIFVKINAYVFEITPQVEVELPIKIIRFLKEATVSVGFFDETAKSQNGHATASNGKTGAHSTKEEKKYLVEFVEED